MRIGSTICSGQELARKSYPNSAVRFVTAKRGPEKKTTKTRQYDLHGQELARKSHPDSVVRFATAKHGPEKATKTRQYDLYGQELARKSHQDSAVRFVAAKHGPEKATETRQYDLLRPRVVQKEPPRLGNTMCYGQELARTSHQDSAVRFVVAKSWPQKATETRQYDLLRANVGQKEPPRLGSTICYGQEVARTSHQDLAVRFVTAKRGPERATKTRQYDLYGQKKPPRLGSTICYGHELARKSHRDSVVQFETAKSCPERVTKTRQYDLLRPRVGQKKPPRLGNTICYSIELSRKSHRNSSVRFVTAKRGPERATKTRQYDLLRHRTICSWPRNGQKEPLRLGSTICSGQTWARKSHQDSAV